MHNSLTPQVSHIVDILIAAVLSRGTSDVPKEPQYCHLIIPVIWAIIEQFGKQRQLSRNEGAPMRFVHVSDLHIGKRVNGMSMVNDQCFILEQIVEIACSKNADALVIAGDIYDKASPSAEAVTVFDGFLTELARRGIRVLATPGNHDSAERIAYAQQLLSNQGVCFPPVFDGTVQHVRLADSHGDVVFWLLPFLKPGDVRRFFPDQEIGDDYAAALRAVLESCEIDPSLRNVIVSHQLVTAAGIAPERADDEIKLGGIDNVDVSVYDKFDYVALGHVHRPQRVGRDTVRYSGSPLKYSFSEARYNKSVVIVDLAEKKPGQNVGECVTFELVPLKPLHDMREVSMTLAELLALGEQERQAGSKLAEDPTPGDSDDAASEANADDDSGNDVGETSAGSEAPDMLNSAEGTGPAYDYLHITLTDEHPQLDAMAKVRELFPNAMTLDYHNAILLAARDQTRSTVDPDQLDTVELFATFYEEQVGHAIDDIQRDMVTRIVALVETAHARGEKPADGGGSGGKARGAKRTDVKSTQRKSAQPAPDEPAPDEPASSQPTQGQFEQSQYTTASSPEGDAQ